jgi:hypothetical protein
MEANKSSKKENRDNRKKDKTSQSVGSTPSKGLLKRLASFLSKKPSPEVKSEPKPTPDEFIRRFQVYSSIVYLIISLLA